MILITGFTGTSGTAFYKLLCEKNFQEKIRVVVRKTTDLSIFKNTTLDLEFAVGDINDVDFLTTAIEGVRGVIHIAAKNRAQAIVEAICNAPQKPFACMISSTTVYSNYYRTSYLKEDEEKYKRKFDSKNIHYVFVRPTMIFGTPSDRNISIFTKWIKKYRFFPIIKHGRATIQPVHKDDLALAYYTILTNIKNIQQTEYIVSGKDEMSLLELFSTISKVLGKKTTFFNVPFFAAKTFFYTVYFVSFRRIDFREKLDRLTEDRAYSHAVFANEFDYNPKSFEQRLQQTIEEYPDYAGH